MKLIYSKNSALEPVASSYCPGCMHSTATKIFTEVIAENNWIEDTILVLPIGCAVNSPTYVNLDMVQCLHGRAAAVATGIKRCRKDKIVITYQGDGDAVSIGGLESFYAANRGEPFTTIMINNQIYGMTGGQMSPTTLVGQKSSTGIRTPENFGYPVKAAEIIASLEAPGFVARCSLHTPKHILDAKKVIKKAIELQVNEKKYSFIELISACPTTWKIAPEEGPEYVEEKVLPIYPLGIFKTPSQ